MSERRAIPRKRSFLQGRIFFNNRRSSVDCLIRDISDTGAKLSFSEAVTVPEVMELYIPTKEEMRRVRAQWRSGNDMGIAFDYDEQAPSLVPDGAVSDLAGRVARLESEVLSLRRLVNELRAENRKSHGEVA
jgi:PilZ domain